ncbi:hypothetical protein [Marinobacter vulgaris]|uniref:hypothetical protein n=1 Tax=Marinobacter vulgaris TaxID=1928331 RepID=UPI001182AFFC|nr:hypothetical protein [Marinobacter vulgaris]TSJ70740.1 hypothetical protein FPC41_07600 [Marinobacter vulgaris]
MASPKHLTRTLFEQWETVWRNNLRYIANAEESLNLDQEPDEVLELIEALKLSGKALEQEAVFLVTPDS